MDPQPAHADPDDLDDLEQSEVAPPPPSRKQRTAFMQPVAEPHTERTEDDNPLPQAAHDKILSAINEKQGADE